jgi:hypothetical protein
MAIRHSEHCKVSTRDHGQSASTNGPESPRSGDERAMKDPRKNLDVSLEEGMLELSMAGRGHAAHGY